MEASDFKRILEQYNADVQEKIDTLYSEIRADKSMDRNSALEAFCYWSKKILDKQFEQLTEGK